MRKFVILCIMLLSFSFAGSSEATIIINEVNMGSSDYFELFNFGLTTINLNGYTANIRDSGFGSFDFTMPSFNLSPNSGVALVAEAPLPGEINAGANIPWFPDRNLSLTLRDPLSNVIDFWAHGSSLFGAPSGVTFSPSPLQLINTSTNTTTYQRISVTSSGINFFASDWIAASASRGVENANQVQAQAPIPEPTTMLLLGSGLIGLAGFRRKLKKS